MKTFSNNDVKILVVDDISENIQVIGSILMEQRYDVSFAKSGAEALEMLGKSNFDLVLLDILMPGMDGFEVCRIIRSKYPGHEVPIVFLTARSDIDSVIRGFELGAQDYLTKPFKTEELLARVRTQVELKKQNEQLERMNENLEQKVKERTNELEKAYQQLGVLENAKNNFLSLISHELRTPLNILNGFTEILQDSLTEQEHLESLRYIRESTEKLINLSETALLITEIQLGKYIRDFQQVNLFELTRDAVSRLSSNTGKLSVKNNVDKDTRVFGDYPLLLNSVLRLLENAAEAVTDSGVIRITASEDLEMVKYTVHDNGPGFTKHDLDKVFDIFNKEIATGSYEGFGLGLPAVKLAMDIHYGKVQLRNAQAGGAEVSLFFPRNLNL